MKIYLLTFLLLASSVMATITDIDSTDFPYQMFDNDSVRIVYNGNVGLNQSHSPANITVNGTGYAAWIIYGNSVENAYVDGNGATIYYDSGGSANSNQVGIGIVSSQSTGKGPYIKDLTIIREVGNDSLSGNFNRAIVLEGGADSTILYNCSFTVDGHEGICLEWTYPGKNSYIRNCEFWAKSASFHRRDHFYESVGAIHISKRNQASEADSGYFQVIIDSCKIREAHHFGIAVYNAAFEIAACSLWHDVWNLFWEETCYPGECSSTMNSWANGYSLVVNQCDAGTEVHDNVIIAGSEHYGARGLLFEDEYGAPNYPMRIYNNEFYLHHGPDGDNANGDLRGIRIRTISPSSNWPGTGYIEVYDNYIEGWVDTDTSTHHIGMNADLLQFGLGIPDTALGGHILIERNTVICRPMDGTGTRCCAGSYGRETDEWVGDSEQYAGNAIIRYNHYFSGDWGIYFGDDYNGFASSWITCVGDTFSPLPAGDSGTTGAYAGVFVGGRDEGNPWTQSESLVVIDPIYENGAESYPFVIYADSVSNSDSAEIYFMATLEVVVIGGRNGAPVVNIPCSVFTTPGVATNLIFVDTTDSTGVLSGVVPYNYQASAGHPSGSDTMDYNDLIVKAYSYKNDSTHNYTVNWDTKNDTITIVEISGTVGAVSIPITGIFVHYSVGGALWGQSSGLEYLTSRLDSTTLIINDDTVDFQFRDYQSNGDISHTPWPLGKLGSTARIENSTADYDLRNGSTDKIRIKWGDGSYPNESSDILDNMFYVWEYMPDSAWGRLYRTHSLTGDSTITGGYDLVIIKNPYGCWYDANTDDADTIKIFYGELVDSIAAHPEINFMACFGTPVLFHTGDAEATGITETDSALIIYRLAGWFIDSLEANSPTADSNVYFSEFYRALCDTTSNGNNQWFLDSLNWANGAGHMNTTGSQIAADSLYQDIIDAVTDIVTRNGCGSSSLSGSSTGHQPKTTANDKPERD